MTAETLNPFPTAAKASAARYRWGMLLIAWAAVVLSTACRLAWGTLALPLGQTLSLPLSALGVFVTAFYTGYVLSNIFCGFLTDRVGGRIALSVSLIGLAAATAGFSFTPSLAIGLVLQSLMGLSAGADYAACVKLVATWFERRERGRAIGLLMSASSVAVIVTNAVLPTFVEAYGWRNSYRALAMLAFVLALICTVLLRDRSQTDVPPADNKEFNNANSVGWSSQLIALMTPNFLWLSLAGCGAFWGTLGFTSWAIPLMAKGHGIPAIQAGLIVAVAGVAGLVSKPTVGWLSDRLGARRKALTVMSLLFFSAMLVIFGQLGDLMAFRLAAPFIGIGAFIYSPLLVTMTAEQVGVSRAGSGAGVANAVWQSGSAFSPLFVGLAFQHWNSFPLAFIVLAAGPLFGAVCMLFVNEATSARDAKPQ